MLVSLDFRTATPDGEAQDAESGEYQPQLEGPQGSVVRATLRACGEDRRDLRDGDLGPDRRDEDPGGESLREPGCGKKGIRLPEQLSGEDLDWAPPGSPWKGASIVRAQEVEPLFRLLQRGRPYQ